MDAKWDAWDIFKIKKADELFSFLPVRNKANENDSLHTLLVLMNRIMSKAAKSR
jgi:hypothetical protein